ncbi:hypothetical protein GGI35DRAFT_442808 [Trichoderma velutinum]
MCGVAFSTTISVTLSINYLIDSYHEIAGDAIFPVIIVRNTMSLLLATGNSHNSSHNCMTNVDRCSITPWLTNPSYKNCFIR